VSSEQFYGKTSQAVGRVAKRNLVVLIYELTRTFPKEETYGLISQMGLAAVSGPSNIAEGAADRSPDQFKNYLRTAIGSLNELNTQLEIAFRIGYLNEADHNSAQFLLDECLAVTFGLRRSLDKKS